MLNTWKRLLSAVLVLAMLVPMVPSVYATEAEETVAQTEAAQQGDLPAEQTDAEPAQSGTEATEGATETVAETAAVTEAATEATQTTTEATETATEATQATTEATETATEATQATTEVTEETEAAEETTEATEETTEATEETTEATEETVDPTEETLVEEVLDEDAMDASAATGEHMLAAGMRVVSITTTNVTNGVTYDKIISRNSSMQQNIGFLTKVDLSKSVTIKAGYGGYYAPGSTVTSRSENAKNLPWSLSKTTILASEYEAAADHEGTVVMATNGDYFNMGTGEPSGYLILEGNVLKQSSASPYFAILKDGTAVIRDAGTDCSDVQEAISGPFYLVKDGVNVADPNDTLKMPRNSVGVCADGSVVFYMNDGRQGLTSVGMTYREIASVLLDAGCVNALYLDGGGSATVAARPEGASSLQIINTPSDGAEREVASGVLVVSTAKATGEFDHASITPTDELYTPGSQIQFTATGVDSSGAPTEIPGDVTWALADSSKDMGCSIDANGLLTTSDKTGVVTVEMRQGGSTVGSAFVEIVSPDHISFNSDEVSLGFEDTTDFGLMVRYLDRDVNIKAGDIVWSTTNDAMGTFDGNLFTSSDGESLNGNVTATSAFDPNVSATIHVIVGMLPTLVWDFEDRKNEDGTVTSAEDYYGSTLTHGNYGRGGRESIEIVSIDSGEPVRFGEKALKLNFDFTQCGEVTEGAIIGTNEGMQIPGVPTGIGVWVYAPEGVGIEWKGDGTQAGFWLRGYVKDGNGTLMPYDFTLEPKALTKPENAGKQPGIYWTGWKYLEADLTNLTPPYSIQSGNTFRLMFVNGTKMGTRSANCIYFDNLQFVYGANVDDTDNPKVDSIKIGNSELNDGDELTTNTISLRASFSDEQNKYTSGVDANTVRMYIDGVNVAGNDHYQFALNANDGYAELYNLQLTDGLHSVTVSLRDNFGNDAEETRYFTVKTGKTDFTTVTVAPVESIASLGGVVTLEVRASDATVTSGSASIRLSNMFPDCEVVFSENFEGTSKYNKSSSTLTLTAQRKDGSSAADGNLIAKILVKVPPTLTQNESFLYEVKSGDYETSTGFYGTYSTAEAKLPVGAAIAISYDPILVGGPKGILKVADLDGNPVANVGIYQASDDALIGTTDEKGQLETDYFSAEAKSVTVYAKAEDGRISFRCDVTSYTAAGSETQLDTQILYNAPADPKTQKSITWISDPLTTGRQRIQYRVKSETAGKQWGTMYADTVLHTFNKDGVYQAANFNSVCLTGLTPGTTYEYQVGNDVTWSEVATFTTAADSSSTKFFVMSDIQADDRTNVNNMVAQIKNSGYQFGIQTGDAIDDMTSYPMVVEAAQLMGTQQMGGIDMIHVLGNHEYAGDGNGKIASSLFNLPVSGPGSYYSITYGDVYIAVINFTGTNAELTTALDWMVKDAQASSATWKVLTLHQPPYYTNASGGNAPINTYVPAAAEQAGIDVVFSGHDHSLARTNRLTGGEIDEENGILYYIGGSSGEKSYSINSQSDFDYEKVFKLATTDFTATYIGVTADKDKMVIDMYDVTGAETKNVVDTITLYTETGACVAAGHKLDTPVCSNGKLICGNCGTHVDPVTVEYTGWATDETTGRSMYFIAGVAQTGKFLLEKDTYYFDENGVALDGKATVDEVEMEFKNGKIVGGYTGFIKKSDGKTYYYENGVKVQGWHQEGDDWYYFDQVSGAMLTGKHIQPDEYSILRNIYYDFGEDGKLVSGYFNKDGVYYWAGERKCRAFVKNPLDPDPDAWYGTNENGHFVTRGNTSGEKTVEYTMDGVVYTFDNSNGKLLKGRIVEKAGKLYYYWAGEPVNNGWFELDGKTYFAYEDGHLAKGSCKIGDEVYMFTSDGQLVTEGLILTASLTEKYETMTVKLVNADKELPGVVFAVWAVGAGQDATLKWIDGEKNGDGLWTITLPMCQFNLADTYAIHAYRSEDGMRGERLMDTTVEVPVAVTHTYTDEKDATCNICGEVREIEPDPAEAAPMYRMYNPNTQEHLLISSADEKADLESKGWSFDGIAWSIPESGEKVYRLYNPYDDFHFYTMSEAEKDSLTPLGWTVDGVMCFSASEEDGLPIYRLFNPYEAKCYHLYTASDEEIEKLVNLGWKLEGVAWYGVKP